MRIVVAPQEFKGSLTATEAAAAIAAGVRDAMPGAEIDEAPMSDGGAGLVDALLAARGGERIITRVHDPLMRTVDAGWALLPGGVAVLEMAAASGLVLLAAEERAPLVVTTYGVGELISAALDRGCTQIIVGVGGSATVDAGAGAMEALGARLLDAAGADLPPGGAALARLERIDLTGIAAQLALVDLRVASDVTNVLCGPRGAAVVFGPQKGASAEDIPLLDAALGRFAEVVGRDFGIDLLTMPGSGAAGGLGAGLCVVASATIESGFDLVAEAVGLDARIAASDLVITGEGRLDAQTAFGKTAAGVARIARAHGVTVGVVAGSVADDFDASAGAFDDVIEATPQGMTIDDAIRDAAVLVRAGAREIIERMARRVG